jgi:hypothetical protein
MRDSVALLQGALGIEHTSVQDVTDVTESVDEDTEF